MVNDMSKKKKEDEQKAKTKQELHKATHKKLNYISSKARINQKELYSIVKQFFEELLELHYEFSHEELIEELKKTFIEREKYESVVTFLKKIGQIEFTKKEFSQEELRDLLEEMHLLLDQLIHQEERKKSFKEKLRDFFFKKETTIQHLDKQIVKDKHRIEGEIKEHHKRHEQELKHLLNELKHHLEKGKTQQAEEHYSKALGHYDSLHELQQKEYYPLLMKLYTLLEENHSKTH